MSSDSKTKVLIVDDSAVVRIVLKRILSTDPDIEIAGTAINGKDALFFLENNSADLILTDLIMPEMDGLELVKEIMKRDPKPIIALSSYVEKAGQGENAFKLLAAGALEALPKPEGIIAGATTFEARDLLRKIKYLAKVKMKAKEVLKKNSLNVSKIKSSASMQKASTVVIGSSTGGPATLQKLFANIPADYSKAIVVAQHISEGFLSGLVEWLDKNLAIRVRIAQDQEKPEAGNIYFAPDNAHLAIDEKGFFKLIDKIPNELYKPCIDELFTSAADHLAGKAVGIILTGMGRDGADGLLKMKENSCYTVSQDEETSVIYGMPKAAKEIGASADVMSLSDIEGFMLSMHSEYV